MVLEQGRGHKALRYPNTNPLRKIVTETLEYTYKAKPLKMLAGIAFFGSCAVFMGYRAAKNTRGLILNGIFTLSVEGATNFYWCVAAVSALFVAVAIVALISGLTNPKVVRLTATELSAPKYMFSKNPTIVPLWGIREIGIQTVQKQRIMHIYSSKGRLSIAQSMLPDTEAFERLYSGLVAGAGSYESGQPAPLTGEPNDVSSLSSHDGDRLLDWSPAAIKATVGLGGLGITMLLLSSLDSVLHMKFWHAFTVSFLPAFIFFIAAPDMLPARAIRVAQWVAIVWYLVLSTLSVAVAAVFRGLMPIDIMFVGFILIGAWPCLLAARKLRSAT
jgi:hypothetical protein